MPKVAQGPSAVQLKLLIAGKESSVRQLQFCSKGIGQSGPEWDEAALAVLGRRTQPRTHPRPDTHLLPKAGQ